MDVIFWKGEAEYNPLHQAMVGFSHQGDPIEVPPNVEIIESDEFFKAVEAAYGSTATDLLRAGIGKYQAGE